jgi:basic membrane protein A
MSVAVFETIKAGLEGTFTGGEDIYVGTLANKGVGVSPEHDVKWGAGIADEVAALEADIVSGKVDVKSSY